MCCVYMPFLRLAARRFHGARAPSPHTTSNTFVRIADTVEKPSPSRMTDVAFSNLGLRVVPNPAFRCDWRSIGNVTSRGWLVRICIGFSKHERPGTCKISISLYSHHDLPTILFAVFGISCVTGSETFLTAARVNCNRSDATPAIGVQATKITSDLHITAGLYE
jgi:hypothetical protein